MIGRMICRANGGYRCNSRDMGAHQGRDSQRASNRTRCKREGGKKVRRKLRDLVAEWLVEVDADEE